MCGPLQRASTREPSFGSRSRASTPGFLEAQRRRQADAPGNAVAQLAFESCWTARSLKRMKLGSRDSFSNVSGCDFSIAGSGVGSMRCSIMKLAAANSSVS